MQNFQAKYTLQIFHFKKPSGTSRGILTDKYSWFIEIHNPSHPEITGMGECSVIPGLSPDFIDKNSYEQKINEVCTNIQSYIEQPKLLLQWPSILFGIETALLDLQNGGKNIIFQNSFSSGEKKIPINGLIWMGTPSFMQEQIEQKIKEGFTCIKMKIGAIDFETEYTLLKNIRNRFTAKEITLRVDANGAFTIDNAPELLDRLSDLDLHSIEQPIRQGNRDAMKHLCSTTKVPIALDEELIGIYSQKSKKELLETIRPQYIILKPSLHGGISGCKEWISLAEQLSIPWWITSALESNIGLNAIAQFTAEYDNLLPQGLGTGSLYTNNIPSDLVVENGFIFLNLPKF